MPFQKASSKVLKPVGSNSIEIFNSDSISGVLQNIWQPCLNESEELSVVFSTGDQCDGLR